MKRKTPDDNNTSEEKERESNPHHPPHLSPSKTTPMATTPITDIVWQSPAHPPHRDDYIFLKGKRYVQPYYFEFLCHVKNRWAGKTIVDMFTDEFRGRPHDYYVQAVKCGRIQVDGQNVSIFHRLKTSQKISHFVHRHEPPVMDRDVSILQDEEEVLTVCKPASVPVHPCGQYRKNTVVGILEAEHGLAPLFPIHRLDRLVSGLLILARSASKAEIFRQQIEAGVVQKKYIAKVAGVFPDGELVVDVNVNHNPREGSSTVEVGDDSTGAKLKGKVACTKFRRVNTNGDYSIVQCEPITGRTHQIRVHLQYAGHPIANDMLYMAESVPQHCTRGMSADRAATESKNTLSLGTNDELEVESSIDFSVDPMCTNCPNLGPKGYDGDEEGLWLHCVRYSGPDWTYECPSPDWAKLD